MVSNITEQWARCCRQFLLRSHCQNWCTYSFTNSVPSFGLIHLQNQIQSNTIKIYRFWSVLSTLALLLSIFTESHCQNDIFIYKLSSNVYSICLLLWTPSYSQKSMKLLRDDWIIASLYWFLKIVSNVFTVRMKYSFTNSAPSFSFQWMKVHQKLGMNLEKKC